MDHFGELVVRALHELQHQQAADRNTLYELCRVLTDYAGSQNGSTSVERKDGVGKLLRNCVEVCEFRVENGQIAVTTRRKSTETFSDAEVALKRIARLLAEAMLREGARQAA